MSDYFARPALNAKKMSPHDIRLSLKKQWADGVMVRFVGVNSPIEAMIVERQAKDLDTSVGLYVSGAGLSTFLGLPDIGVMTLDDLVYFTQKICDATNLPVLVDVDTGYHNITETVSRIEDAGAAAIHIEDQVFPKRCGHLDGKDVVPLVDMQDKIAVAVSSKKDDDFIIMARSDARAVEGFDAMIERLKAYVEAGADACFPEAMTSVNDFQEVKDALGDVPLLANLTENGKTPLGLEKDLAKMGYGLALYPVTLMRSHMKFVHENIQQMVTQGNVSFQDKVMERAQCMDYLLYDEYVAQDEKLSGHGFDKK